MLVSIYLPTRNRLSLLQAAARSVLAQSYSDIELVIVNDGSEDGTTAYLERLQKEDGRVRTIHNALPGGGCRARNQAILAATGEFVTGLDDDDLFHPNRIELLVSHWNSYERMGRAFSCLFTQDVLDTGTASSVTRKPRLIESSDLFFYNLIGNQIFTRRSRLIDSGLYDQHMQAWQDLELFIRVLMRFGPALLVDSALYTLNLSPREDRISMGEKSKIMSAYRRLSDKHASSSRIHRQGLFLQVFGQLYGFSFDHRDLREYLRHGIHLRTLRSLVGIVLRQMQRKRAATG